MSERLATVNLDGVLVTETLLGRTHQQLVRTGLVPRLRQASTEAALLGSIASGMRGRHVDETIPSTDVIGSHFTRILNWATVRKLQRHAAGGFGLVVLSSAPDFVVDPVIEMIEDRTELSFAHVLASEYGVGDDNRFTGRHEPLNRLDAVDNVLVEHELDEISTAYINNIGDLEWTDLLCKDAVPILPSPQLAKELLLRQAQEK